MSSSAYVLKIAIDDSKIKEIEKRLMNIVGGQAGTGGLAGKITGAAGGGGTSGMMKNIAKLAGIAIGVAAVVTLVQKIADLTVASSPMLQQMFKLINFGVMLLLRPIGDFFGFFLRPIVIYFLRSVILPWYRIARPLMAKAGQWLGSQLVTNPVGTLTKFGVFGQLPALIANWDSILALANKFLGGIGETINTWIASLNLPSLSQLSTGIITWIDTQLSGLVQWWYLIWSGINSWIQENIPKLPSWEAITTGINEWITNAVALLPSWDDITKSLSGIHTAILNIAEAIKNFFIDLAAKFGIDISGLINTPKASAISEPVGISNPEEYMYPWLTETPQQNMSDHTKGHGR